MLPKSFCQLQLINQSDESLTQYRYSALSTKLDIEYICSWHQRAQRPVTMTAATTLEGFCAKGSVQNNNNNNNFVQVSCGKDNDDRLTANLSASYSPVRSLHLIYTNVSTLKITNYKLILSPFSHTSQGDFIFTW